MKSTSWYVCVYVREFPAQALLRDKPELLREAVVVMQGQPPLERVCSRNRAAAKMGLEPGMTRVETDSYKALHVLPRNETAETRARAVLLNCLAEFTPLEEWMECEDDTHCALVMDIGGSIQLFGSPIQIAEQVKSELDRLGIFSQLGISQNFHAAVLLAMSSHGISLAEESEVARYLEHLPVSLLTLTVQQKEIFEAWGIESLGKLRALPEKELVSRMGQQGRRLQLLARGELPHLFQPVEAPFLLEERLELEEAVENFEFFIFCLDQMIEKLILTARERVLAIAALRITAQLEGGEVYSRILRPALPTCDHLLLLNLVHIDVSSNLPTASISSLEVCAEAGVTGKVQLGLFSPQLPEPSRLQVTLARIAGIVGEQKVGWAKITDTHREDDYTIEAFQINEHTGQSQHLPGCTAIRRLRPPVLVAPRLHGRKPRWFCYAGKPYTVKRSFGPWQKSGMWWSGDIWSIERWDVLAYSPAEELLLCVLANNRLNGSWNLEAIYD